MAVKKTVAAPSIASVSIPETASTAGELETAVEVTATQMEALEDRASSTADAVRKSKVDSLAKAREA